MEATTKEVTIYRIDHTGIHTKSGGLLYLRKPNDDTPEREVVAMMCRLPEAYEPWAAEDGSAYCNLSNKPGTSGCQMVYDKYTRRVVLVDAEGRECFAAHAYEIDG